MSPPPRPHFLARSPLVQRTNTALEKAWNAGWFSRPSLDPEALWQKAVKSAPAQGEHGGRSDEDAADFRRRLEQLCACLIDEAALNPLGLTVAHGQLVRAIRQRLRLGALWLRKPELLEAKLAPPIIVVGHMRSGTTRLHRLLAVDPAHCSTRFCDSWHPVPARPDLRALWSALSLLGARRINPWLDGIHPFGSTLPDEELGWLASALDHCAYEVQWRIPAFSRFSEARDPAPAYREFGRILQTDAAHHGNAALPRVMKVPQFSEDLSTVLAQFPDARVVIARRNLGDVLRSSVSLVANQMTIQSDSADIEWIEQEWRRKIALREARMKEGLTSFSGPVAAIDYEAMEGGWEAAIAAAYHALDLPLTGGTLSAMAAEQQRAGRPRSSLGDH